jgi:acyl-CoA reductase-like NAD-dependent aldehyde dehydrogenase
MQAMKKTTQRLSVLKTYKLFIGGQFPRTESGRYYAALDAKGNKIANLCLASRKDCREAIVSARGALGSWSQRAAYNRSQILYRIAEMLETRKDQFLAELQQQGLSRTAALSETTGAIDRLIHYAGWCDKYQALFSTVNPVASSHYNFSVCEPMGVVAIVAPASPLLGLVSVLAPCLAGGNTAVVLANQEKGLCAVSLAEVLHSADVPGGVVNILTGSKEELLPWIAEHRDVNALVYAEKDTATLSSLRTKATGNLKRIIHWPVADWQHENAQSPYLIADLQEIKTTWHPIQQIAGSGAPY